jgi:hypothetical protein
MGRGLGLAGLDLDGANFVFNGDDLQLFESMRFLGLERSQNRKKKTHLGVGQSREFERVDVAEIAL